MFSWDCIFEALSVPKGFADFHANLHWRSLMCCSWISFDFAELPFIDACHPPFHCVLHVNKKSYTPLIFSCKFRPAQPFTTCMCCLFWISFPPTSFRVHHKHFFEFRWCGGRCVVKVHLCVCLVKFALVMVFQYMWTQKGPGCVGSNFPLGSWNNDIDM